MTNEIQSLVYCDDDKKLFPIILKDLTYSSVKIIRIPVVFELYNTTVPLQLIRKTKIRLFKYPNNMESITFSTVATAYKVCILSFPQFT